MHLIGGGHSTSLRRPDSSGSLCFIQRDRADSASVTQKKKGAGRSDYLTLIRTPSYVFNTVAQTAMTFALGGIAFWVAAYLKFRGQPASSTKYFGLIIVVAGLISTLLGGWAGDRLRKGTLGSYFLVSGVGMSSPFRFLSRCCLRPFPLAGF